MYIYEYALLVCVCICSSVYRCVRVGISIMVI